MLHPAPRSSRGFSLVELLVVLGIMAIMMAIMVPSITSVMRSYQLDSAAQGMLGQLTFARQTAQTEGGTTTAACAVQVRIYELPDYNQSSTGAPAVYRGMQAFLESAPTSTNTVTVTAITKPYFFPAPIIISTNTTVSTLLNQSPTLGSTLNPSFPLPVYQNNYKYVVFRFTPTGQTDLPATQTLITLISESAATTHAAYSLPANYQTIQIDPINGAIRSYRP